MVRYDSCEFRRSVFDKELSPLLGGKALIWIWSFFQLKIYLENG